MRNHARTLLFCVAIGLPSTFALAQPVAARRVAFLAYGCPVESERPNWPQKFRDYLGDLGHVEGRNLIFDLRYANADASRLPALAADLIALKPDALIANSYEVTEVVQKLTKTVPVLFSGTGDPVAAGFVASLARPGGNLTGIAFTAADLSGKHLELLRKLSPRAVRLAVLAETGSLSYVERRLKPRADAVGFTVIPIAIDSQEDFPRALAEIRGAKAEALITAGGAFFVCKRRQIADLARQAGIPSVYALRDAVEAGGLISYGPNVLAITRLAARITDRILRGAKPADLPVEQPDEYELVVNVGVAKALGIAIPQEILVLATIVE